MIRVRINQIKTLLIIKLFSLMTSFIKKKVWVICERGTDARDNGYCFYKYVKRVHPEIKVYYIIDKKSADYKKVEEDAVQYGSIKNYWVVSKAECIISSHIGTCAPYLIGKPFRLSGVWKKFYFLQHGIIKDDLIILHKENAPMRLFICGAKPEYDYIKDSFGHDLGVVQYTGLARYDNLHNIETKKQILLMPTWRQYIQSKDEFLNSQYFRQWQGLLENEALILLLEKSGYELIFYPHYEIQKYLNCFTATRKCIKLASFKDYDVQILLKESILLITDFSSVFFDFAYMKKPIIFFQFDAQEFSERHYKKGYFDYKRDGFGKICFTAEEVVTGIKNYLLNDFIVEEVYSRRIEKFFPLQDQNNCQRIYERITEIK